MATLHYYLHQLRVLPFREVMKRALAIGNRIVRDQSGKVRAHVFGTVFSDKDFMKDALSGVFRSSEEYITHIRARRHPVFFYDFLHRDETLKVLLGQNAKAEEMIITQANRTCHHVFALLGSGDVQLGDRIDWHADFKTGYCWDPRIWYRDISIPFGKADIKVPLELSRFSHAVTLGQAYWLTNDEKYASEFADQANNWIDSNKPQFGVNWTCTMDVAIRVCNWMAGYAFFAASPSLTNDFLLKFLKSLYQHGRHIRENLEYSETLTSNHYLSNITGLVYLGVLFPEFREAEGWKEFGIRELQREMEKQVYPDGCDFEASTCYHRLVLELFFFPTLLAAINDPSFRNDNHYEAARAVFGDTYMDRLHRMFEAVLYLLKPNGRMPQIGDNDSGRLHIFAHRDVMDMRYLLTLGAVFFKDHRFKLKEFGCAEEAGWVFGAQGPIVWGQLQGQCLADAGSHAFPDAGWYVMRNGRDYLFISCGQNGQKGNGGHCHNDKLSFELCLDGADIFVDPGSYVYTPEPQMRNLFRSTGYHNTVTVNSLEQNRLDTGLYLFHLKDDSEAKSTLWESDASHALFSGEHFGFDKYGYHHQRTVHFSRHGGSVRITDVVTGTSPHSIACFHILPGESLAERGEGIFSVRNVLITFKGHSRIETSDSWYSPEYGRKEKCLCLRVFFSNSLDTFISRE